MGSRFTFGLGVDTCSLDPAFGVRNRPCAAMVRLKLPCLWEKSQKRVFSGRVRRCAHVFFYVARVALCDIRRVSGGMCVHDRL